MQHHIVINTTCHYADMTGFSDKTRIYQTISLARNKQTFVRFVAKRVEVWQLPEHTRTFVLNYGDSLHFSNSYHYQNSSKLYLSPHTSKIHLYNLYNFYNLYKYFNYLRSYWFNHLLSPINSLSIPHHFINFHSKKFFDYISYLKPSKQHKITQNHQKSHFLYISHLTNHTISL